MLFLLPPSETKRDGGASGPLDLDALSFASLTDARRVVLDALRSLSTDDSAAARALKLGPAAAVAEVARNRAVMSSATMPAIERYTGVLYDALAVRELGVQARARASRHVVVHSALFGLLRADDAIPAYRLSHDSRLHDLRLRAHWSAALAAVLAGLDRSDVVDGPIVDLRSEGYVGLGPLPAHPDAVFVRVVAVGADGVVRALNHFNKKGKGEFVRAVLGAESIPTTIDELCHVSTELGWPLRRVDGARVSQRPGLRRAQLQRAELQLIVPGQAPAR